MPQVSEFSELKRMLAGNILSNTEKVIARPNLKQQANRTAKIKILDAHYHRCIAYGFVIL